MKINQAYHKIKEEDGYNPNDNSDLFGENVNHVKDRFGSEVQYIFDIIRSLLKNRFQLHKSK